MRICIVYDCLFPWTIGGAERWYRNVAEHLAAEGHEITYLTLRQWEEADPPRIPGVHVVSVGPRMALYDGEKRRIGPPLRFGLGVFLHLARRGRNYDVVHCASFPFFSLLAIGMLRPWGRYRIVCDWHEVWSRDYWRSYLGPVGGIVGSMVQWLCAKVPQSAFAFSRLHAARAQALGLRGDVQVLTGEYAGDAAVSPARDAVSPPLVAYAGRMIAEKRVPLLVEAIAVARASIPDLRARLIGKGPDFERVARLVAALGLDGVIELPGFVSADEVDDAMRTALCVTQPSSREGYGMVVVEASARGVPAIVVAGEDNAAVELIEPGVNGFIAREATAKALAEEIVRCWRAGPALRATTRDWFARNEERLSLRNSMRAVSARYCGFASPANPGKLTAS